MNRQRQILFLVLLTLLLAAGFPASGQTLKPGPQVMTFFSDVDDSEQPYGLYLPANFSPKKKYPLVISLHGAGSNHRLNLRRVFGKSNLEGENDVEATRYFPAWPGVDVIVASPLARGTMGYQGIAEKDVYDVLADVKKRFPIDEDRVYLTGLSMGGGGTLWLGLTRPDVWAAIAPVCPAGPPETLDFAPNALNLPVHIFQGGADPVVEPAGVRDWATRLQNFGTKVEYTEYPGVGHNSWENAYKDGSIFVWLTQFKKNRFPDRVRFLTSRYKYGNAYWIRIDQLTPGTLASIDAKFVGQNRLEITTSELSAVTLDLAGHPKFKANRPLEITIDGAALTARAADPISLSRRDGTWGTEAYQAAPGTKRLGEEGPIDEAISSRHIYVYGSGGNPPREELQARREQAAKAADWSAQRVRLLFYPRVVADRDVRPSDLESSNLILFGTKETNTLIEKFSDRLPFHLDPAGAAGYGLVYVYPVDGHYVVISSGLPWWTPPPAAPAPTAPAPRRFLFLGGTAQAFTGFKDFILFKDSAATAIADGRFDNDWRIPEADAEKLRASGAVIVK
jgi:dipeptidyl aminopeptidase/acylaminoacyl peptidase